jgi:methyl-accepting chemotaxis protein
MFLRTIQTKITFWAGVCLVVTAGTIVFTAVMQVRENSLAAAREQALGEARARAGLVDAHLSQAVSIARGLAQTLSAVNDEEVALDLSRDNVAGMLKIVLKENPSIVGVFTAFEPDAFDKMDKAYAGVAGQHPTGRFMPWCGLDSANKTVQAIAGAEPGSAPTDSHDWYDVPRTTKSESIGAPRMRTFATGPKLISRVTVPIVVKQKFFGVVGVDCSLAFAAEAVAPSATFGGHASLSVVARDGTVIASGTDRSASGNKAEPWTQAGEAADLTGAALRCGVPMKTAGFATPWDMILTVPKSEITAGASAIMRKQMAIGAALIAAGLALLWFASASIARPVRVAARSLESLSENDRHLSERLGASAERTSKEVDFVSTTASELEKSVESVATATGQMSASIQSIARNTAEATQVATRAVQMADLTNATVTQLGVSSREIGEVVKIITQIASHTNLLALNATIEAARAGEAGLGFAVVANEVKDLARQTAAATGDISAKINAIQSDASKACSAIHDIGAIIRQINEIQVGVAASIDEQATTTNDISRNVSDAAEGSSRIAQAIASVAEAAQNTAVGAKETQEAAANLSRTAASLQSLVGHSG